MVENSDEKSSIPDPIIHVSPVPKSVTRDPYTISAHSFEQHGAGPGRYGISSTGPISNVGDPRGPSTSPQQETSTMAKEASPPGETSASPQANEGETSTAIGTEEKSPIPNIAIRFYKQCREILFSSCINILLVFVPIGIAVQIGGANKNIVFAMNTIAIVPLAGLLSHATESVASEMGDTIGSLMNVTFGNAVELIIFIALTKNEIRIVQASLLGSILANLLLILGMCFLVGGLRYREQIYNSTVTQMSACLLSLSVMSLLLPTAFHASFTDSLTADRAVLKVSRGTSVILLLIYILYLLFQLKSHAYMYQSTPQHVIDEESHPGLLHDMLNSSSSSDGSSSSSESNTDDSSGSVTTAKRIRRVLRGRRRRKSSTSSTIPSTLRTPSAGTATHSKDGHDIAAGHRERNAVALGAIASGDEADTDGEHGSSRRARNATINFRDFENEKVSRHLRNGGPTEVRSRRNHRSRRTKDKVAKAESKEVSSLTTVPSNQPAETFVDDVPAINPRPDASTKRPFNLRGLSVRGVVPAAMPAVQNMIASTVFSTANPTGIRPNNAPLDSTPHTLHRSSSLPSRLNQSQVGQQGGPAMQPQPYALPVSAARIVEKETSQKPQKLMSRTSAVILLLVSTGLVAVCAEFLVASIDYLVETSNVSEAFIGLIILPIVGNAAEHVTAVTVASKNKMDLAIGVAVGSSIQIALFVTPVIVLLGWILEKDMSLYFSLFETISLFVSAFIVNFLLLSSRSNYLEGALLIAAYVIIALAAFFYPDSDAQSSIGGASSGPKMML